MFCAILSNADKHRELAQFGSALRSGRRGHGFESRIPDYTEKAQKLLNNAVSELFFCRMVRALVCAILLSGLT